MTDDEALQTILKHIVARSRTSAAKRSICHSLPDDHALSLYQLQNGRCDVTGLPFSMQRFPDAFVKHPFAPSLDRRDSKGGYTADNVRLVYANVNFGLGQWGQEVYLYCARAAVDHQNDIIVALEPPQEGALAPIGSTKRSRKEAAWVAGMRERLAAAEAIAATLAGEERKKQGRRIASLKRNLSLGPAGLALAGRRAAAARRI